MAGSQSSPTRAREGRAIRLNAIPFQVDDLIETPGFVIPRTYIVLGIHLGAVSQESVVELSPVEYAIPDAHGYKANMYVPVEMLTAGIHAGVFQHTIYMEPEK